jgi:hypothetical protein
MKPKPMFGIGDPIFFGDEEWTVVKYHKIGSEWEILLRSKASGVHKSFACNQLEGLAFQEEKGNEEPTSGNFLHRDDLDMEEAECITNFLKEKFPGYKVSFAGDIPEGQIPPGLVEADAKLTERMNNSLQKGICFECGTRMSNAPPKFDGEWNPPKGWSWYSDPKGEPMFFVCPNCEKEELV